MDRCELLLLLLRWERSRFERSLRWGDESRAILTLIEFEGDKDEVGGCLECVLEEMVENGNVSQWKK